MSAWKDLVVGQGCGTMDGAGGNTNPLSHLANGLLRPQEYGSNQGASQAGPSSLQKSAAAENRTRRLTRQLMPGLILKPCILKPIET